ncbi:hypothetical protein [Campylobacter hyointestinalis]|uniref:hypothetical protein n=1 Tax=Campylobacter hyointestinalis TaxID=198 RepID=UPI0007257BE3|nr:hypothetical protein [Campylobacter hyointestinalis]CUU91930.1 Uncharacterised protein [Campylobacter hyointestinalis subsp. hyointestinalis]
MFKDIKFFILELYNCLFKSEIPSNKKSRKKFKWSEESENFIIDGFNKGLDYNQLANAMAIKHPDFSPSSTAIRHRLKKLNLKSKDNTNEQS